MYQARYELVGKMSAGGDAKLFARVSQKFLFLVQSVKCCAGFSTFCLL